MKLFTSILIAGSFCMNIRASGALEVDWGRRPDITITAEEREAYIRQVRQTIDLVGVGHIKNAKIIARYAPSRRPPQRVDVSIKGENLDVNVSCYRPIDETISSYINNLGTRLAEAATGLAPNIETEEQREEMRRRAREFTWSHSQEEAEKVGIEWIKRLLKVDVNEQEDEWGWELHYSRWHGTHRMRFTRTFHNVPLLIQYVGAHLSDIDDLKLLACGHNKPPDKLLPRSYPEMIDMDRAVELATRYRAQYFADEPKALEGKLIGTPKLVWTYPNFNYMDRESKQDYWKNPPRFIWMVTFEFDRPGWLNALDIWVDAVTGEMVGGSD